MVVVVVGMKKMGRDEWAFYTRGGVADWLTAPRDGRCGSRIRGPRLLGFFGGIPPHSGWARCASRCFGSEQDPALRSRFVHSDASNGNESGPAESACCFGSLPVSR